MGAWKALVVPQGPEQDSLEVTPLMEGNRTEVMTAYESWREGNDETPLKEAEAIVIHDDKGHTRYCTSTRS